MKHVLFQSFLLLSLVVFALNAWADVSVVVIDKNGNLTWNNFSSGTGLSSTLGSFGSSKDVPILGSWLDGGGSQIGTAHYDKQTKTVVWQVVDATSAIHQKVFGQKKDLIIAGADFDGNGITDAAVARLKSGQVNWEIENNVFSSSPALPVQLIFGGNGSRVFYANPEGTRDWIGVIGANTKGKSILQMKDLVTGAVHTSKRFPRWLTQGQRPRPFPVKQADGKDILGFARTKSKSTQLHFRSVDGLVISNFSIPGSGKVIVGDFNDAPGEEVALKQSNKTSMHVINPFSGFESEVSVPVGVAVDSFNVRAIQTGFADDDTGDSTPDDNQGGGGGNDAIPGGAGKISCSNVVDIAGLPDVLFKNENLHGGRGRTLLDQGHRMGGARTIQVAGLNGVIFGCFGLYACDNPYGCRYYQAMCGDSKSNSQFAGAARANGGGSSYAVVGTGSGTCYKFRADVSRYGNVRK